MKKIAGGITAAKGFYANGIRAGLKESGDYDMALVFSRAPCAAAGTFTRNKIRASCVDWCNRLLPADTITALFCNSGNANACTGTEGKRNNEIIAQELAANIDSNMRSVLVASTGVIGRQLPMKKITCRIPQLVQGAAAKNSRLFSRAIMTTDTVPKEYAVQVQAPGGTYRIGGSAKGSGMIHPDMATMLAFITTDAAIDKDVLHHSLKKTVGWTFNNLTVDGDCSTNDMALALANGASGNGITSKKNIGLFEKALFDVCNNLCAKIAGDGEGATKRIEVNVTGGKTCRDAKLAAKAVANSNLVKTALFGNDPNWGRILCAIGYSGARFSKNTLLVSLCKMPVCKGPEPVAFPTGAMHNALRKKVVVIDIDLGLGTSCAVAHTCDLTYDYIKINAEYHT
ncbi:MAG: bifunctional glutamate N-acetyltransferase/amino-acid acetyltransferase ArgJ [Chitinivibrionales bacterium]|nr:bifunctional glutamate N-acetyltransferase/amino-acid acetyltransferase ArgJ [Chitinivibrionales bacterium]